VSETKRKPEEKSAMAAGLPQEDATIPQPHWERSITEAPLDFAKMGGLVPAIIQDHQSHEVLMLGFMNEDAWEKTVKTGLVTFWSRTRKTLWTKGETSGNVLRVKRLWIDCDSDTLLVEVDPKGPTCHTGARSCFFEEIINA
jgi:phosphoribosyl-ATP pyrophosphohydrolase/phosphoribosyl-AMP cyclohydrolase